MKSIMKLLLLLALFLSPVPLTAQHGGGPRGGGGPHMEHMNEEGAGRLRDILNLNEEQVRQLKTLRQQHQQETRALREEMHSLRKELMESYSNKKEVERIAKRTGEIHEKLTLLMAKNIQDISSILTTEQMRTFEEIKQQRHPGKGKKQK